LNSGYYHFNGTRERNPKWLQAEYVRFLRVCQWHVDLAARGVVALVLSDGIADNMTFRGLRSSLMDSFQAIYLLALGGSSRKGNPDESLFGIGQGACVFLGVRGGSEKGCWHATVQGTTAVEKLDWLGSTGFGAVAWQPLSPSAPSFCFGSSGPVDREYDSALSIPEIFTVGSIGVITGRDRWAIGLTREDLAARLADLREERGSKDHGVPRGALEALQQDDDWQSHIRPYLFRPFDRRVVFGAPYWLERPRAEVMTEVVREGNFALVLPRRRRHFPCAWVSEVTTGHKVASSYEGSHIFPLYLGAEFRPNFTSQVYARLQGLYGTVPSPRRIVGFIYGLLWDRLYHERHKVSLGRGWPRIIFPRDSAEFEAQADLGWQLVELHLGRKPRQAVELHGRPSIPPVGDGKPYCHDGNARLFLGSNGYLEPVPREVLDWRVGGYLPVAGWIRRRRGRELDRADDLAHLVEVLETTHELTQAWVN